METSYRGGCREEEEEEEEENDNDNENDREAKRGDVLPRRMQQQPQTTKQERNERKQYQKLRRHEEMENVESKL